MKTALITGASGGIGLDFAHIFAEKGYNVVLVARSEDKLKALADELEGKHKIKASVMPMDLTDPQSPQALYDALQGTAIDVLVNNAGFASYGKFHELDLNKELAMIQLNITTLTHLTHLFMNDMVARGSGYVMNVASTAAFQPGPLMAVYYATKAYVLHFSEAIANEVKDAGVKVTALCPGPTQSGFQSRAAMEESKLVQNGLMDSRTVAEAGVDALFAGKPFIITGMQNKMLAFSTRLMPRTTIVNIVRNTQERVSH
jgi:uncharacterized protein